MEMTINKSKEQKKNKVFFGKLWVNTVKNESSKSFGKKFMSGNIDNKFEQLAIGVNDQIQIWPNKKREDKKDADFRMVLLTDSEIPEGINGPKAGKKQIETSEINKIMS